LGAAFLAGLAAFLGAAFFAFAADLALAGAFFAGFAAGFFFDFAIKQSFLKGFEKDGQKYGLQGETKNKGRHLTWQKTGVTVL